MADHQQGKDENNDQVATFDDACAVPAKILETQLIGSALGDCAGLVILDLGGSAGLRARQAIDAGAKAVDVVNPAPEMMKIRQDIEASLGRHQINWYEADFSKPLDHLRLRSYDLVMANWVFDHAASVREVEGMWSSVVANLKPGGRFVGVLAGDPFSPAITSGKYGTSYKEVEKIHGGVKARCVLHVNPPFEVNAMSWEVSYSGSTEMHDKFGLEDAQIVPYEEAAIIKQDAEGFWEEFLDQPSMAVVTARKRTN